MRVPMIVRWPEKVPAGETCSEIATTMDFLPTFCAITGAALPSVSIDGYDIQPLLYEADNARSPYEVFYYYRRRQLQAVRKGDWKYHLKLNETHPNWTTASILGDGRPAKLINLADDLQETIDLSKTHPEKLKEMKALAQLGIEKYGNDASRGIVQRDAYTLPSSTPMVLQK